VAHAYNPNYSGGSDQEDLSSKSSAGKQSVSTYLKKHYYKKGLGEWLKQ
jgi:hypothetical protein